MSDETQTRASRRWQLARTLLGFALLAVIAFLAWPSNLGGLTTLDVVAGHSMEPKFHTGDLVVARAGLAPKVGDVIVYQPPGLKTRALIVHRIIGVAPNGGWVMKGDNNDFIDPFQPKADDVLGIVVIHLPGVGAILRSPLVWGSLLVVAASLLLLTSGLRSGRGKDLETDETDDAVDGAAVDALDVADAGLLAIPVAPTLTPESLTSAARVPATLTRAALTTSMAIETPPSPYQKLLPDDSSIDPAIAALLRDIDALLGRDVGP